LSYSYSLEEKDEVKIKNYTKILIWKPNVVGLTVMFTGIRVYIELQ